MIVQIRIESGILIYIFLSVTHINQYQKEQARSLHNISYTTILERGWHKFEEFDFL